MINSRVIYDVHRGLLAVLERKLRFRRASAPTWYKPETEPGKPLLWKCTEILNLLDLYDKWRALAGSAATKLI